MKKYTFFLFLISLALLLPSIVLAAQKPQIINYTAKMLETGFTVNVYWLSRNPVILLKVVAGGQQKDVKIDENDNRSSVDGFSGEITFTVPVQRGMGQTSMPYAIQLEDDLRQRSEMVNGVVVMTMAEQQGMQSPMQPMSMPSQPMMPSMPSMPMPALPMPTDPAMMQQGMVPPPEMPVSAMPPSMPAIPAPDMAPAVNMAPPQSPVQAIEPAGKGGIRVIILPSELIKEGAAWKLQGVTEWSDKETEGALNAGKYTLEFKPVSGYKTPAVKTVEIRDRDTVEMMVIYIKL